MLKKMTKENSKMLYDFYKNNLVGTAPYFHAVSRNVWTDDFFEDRDYEGELTFKELLSYCCMNEEKQILGFVQFGQASYMFDSSGEKNFAETAGIIRQLYFLEGHASAGKELLEKAEAYFEMKGIKKEYAFFHAFGMSFTGAHGKLYETYMKEMEPLLVEAGFGVEHENVYYIKKLEKKAEKKEFPLVMKRAERTPQQTQMLTFYQEHEAVGQANIAYLSELQIAYLRWIFLLDEYQNKGLGSQMLAQLFTWLSAKGIKELHTDTADNNLRAQHIYLKNGFSDEGRTRSYQVQTS